MPSNTTVFRQLEATDNRIWVYRIINLIILIIVFILILSGNIGLATIGWFIAAFMIIGYSYYFRNTLKKYMGISDSINIGNKYYDEHLHYYTTIKGIKDNFTDFSSVASITNEELTAYQHELEKMKKLSDNIMDPEQRSQLKVNNEMLRDKATNTLATYSKYINALQSIDNKKIEYFSKQQ